MDRTQLRKESWSLQICRNLAKLKSRKKEWGKHQNRIFPNYGTVTSVEGDCQRKKKTREQKKSWK